MDVREGVLLAAREVIVLILVAAFILWSAYQVARHR